MAHTFQGSQLGRRGWTLQERLISRRTLYFGDIVYYECCKETISESGRSKNNSVQYSNIQKLLPSEFKQIGTLDTTFQGSEMVWWSKRVETYTLGKLTIKNDRLIALTGIIDSIEKRTRFKNIAGFWEPLTGQSLIWTAMEQGFTNNRSLLYPGIQSICRIETTRSAKSTAERSGLGVDLLIRGPFFRISSIEPSFPEQILKYL
ncbi:hypothetical protein BJ875DRAFT_481510 [Amylocarpus encephaloides]|uniref:Uncharacterized protein n=1 Tax=Amylocarpus encephaloides TaxID=45428 RepID=A0A9P7YP88_9HELO|nr:hypothetical protein BJ875DRAFT_481510 [Amylocarpus encephaloides]